MTATSDRSGSATAGGWLQQWTLPIVLVCCTGVSVLSTDLYTPSLPHLPALLATDESTVQLTMSLNLAAYALAQLFHGPLADRFGRRALLVAGMLGSIVASLACAAAAGIDTLLVGRVAQGVFSSVPSVVVMLLIREVYGGGRAVQVMGFHGMALGLAPAVGPLLGGWVFLLLGWRANFLLLAAIAAVVLALIARHVPETATPDPWALRPRRVLRGYLRLLTIRAYLRLLVPLTLVFGALFAFVTAGPFVLIDRLGVATQNYGWCHAVIVAAYVVGSLAASRLAAAVPIDRLVAGGLGFALAGGLALVAPLTFGVETLAAVLLPMCLYAIGLGLLLASGPVLLLGAAGDGPRGAASALVGTLQLAAASLAAFAVGAFHDGTAWPLAVTIAGMTGAAAAAYCALRPPRAVAE